MPERLEIEITESAFLEDGTPILELLHSLRALGVRVARDDVGTGYSSLGGPPVIPLNLRMRMV